MDYTQYYTPDRLRRIRKSKSYQDLLAVALEVLVALNKNHAGPIVQVCGPISNGGRGTRQENLFIFKRVIEQVCADGLVVFNQMPFEDDMERIFKSDADPQGVRLLEEFYGPIFESGLLQMLCFFPGWAESLGAVWEYHAGKRLGLPVIFLADQYVIG